MCTVAAALKEKLKVVPTGTLRARERDASFEPSRHLDADWLNVPSTGAAVEPPGGGVAGGASTVTEALVADAVTPSSG
jgi:hypothetical protein